MDEVNNIIVDIHFRCPHCRFLIPMHKALRKPKVCYNCKSPLVWKHSIVDVDELTKQIIIERGV